MYTATRRDIIKSGSKVVGGSLVLGLARPSFLGATNQEVPDTRDPYVKVLIQRALDAALSSGATYADVRLSRLTYMRYLAEARVNYGHEGSWGEVLDIGVRSLNNGYWGFASGSIWNEEEASRLGRSAAQLAANNSLGKPRKVVLAPVSIVKDEHWESPVQIDPFQINRKEIGDIIRANYIYATDLSRGFTPLGFHIHDFARHDKVFGSSEGSYFTQRILYTDATAMSNLWKFKNGNTEISGMRYDAVHPATLGFERYVDGKLQEAYKMLYEELKENIRLPIKPVDVGRYDTVLDAGIVASVIGPTVGRATQLDVVLGYESNAGGTSYINDPEVTKGKLVIGSSLLNVSANRNEPGAAATIRWDDESVEPSVFDLVRDGTIVDFQTTRESASWMDEWSTDKKKQSSSRGCANAPSARDIQITHTPNLVMKPGKEELTFSTLLQTIDNGVAFTDGAITMDFQCLNGYGLGEAFEVKKGKKTARLGNAAILMRAPEFWKSLIAIGGKQSTLRFGTSSKKGQPQQTVQSSIDSVPIAIKDLTIIDKLRKA